MVYKTEYRTSIQRIFVPCNSHSLNLVANDAAKSCQEETYFSNLLLKIYNYFSASAWCQEVPKRHVSGDCCQGFKSRHDALKPMKYYLIYVHDPLMEIL